MVVTRRRSAAMAKAGSQRSGTVSSSETSSSASKTVQMSTGGKSVRKTKTTVVTQTVMSKVDSHTQHSQSLIKSQADELEPWELLPKTDYTYAKSASYSPKYLDQDWIMPNMSRPRLRNGLLCSLDTSDQEVSDTESRQASYLGHMTGTWRQTEHLQSSEEELTSGKRGRAQLSDSVTRSGQRYGLKGYLRTLSRFPRGYGSITDLTVNDYIQLEKRMEYSGQSAPCKEASRLSLFGLDHADDAEFSDTETSLKPSRAHVQSSQSSGHFTSLIWSLITAIISIITFVIMTVWKVTTAPVVWFVSLIQAIFGSTTTSTEGMDAKSLHIYDKHLTQNCKSNITTESHINTVSSQNTYYSHSQYRNSEQFSDDEYTDTTATTSLTGKYSPSNNQHRSAYDLEEERSAEEESWFSQCCIVLIAVAYILFIALPAGLFKAAKTSTLWLFTYLLLPVVDGARYIAGRGYSAVTSLLTGARHDLITSHTDNTSITHTTTSIMHKESSVYVYSSSSHGVGLYTTIADCAGRVWSALCTTVQMVAVLLWLPLAAISNCLCHGALAGWCWTIGTWIHWIAARVLLLDVWILSRSGKKFCCCLLPLLLLLIPFLLMPVSKYVLEALPKEKAGASVFVSDKVDVPVTTGISYTELRQIINQEITAAKAEFVKKDVNDDYLAYIQQLEKQIKECCKSDAHLAGLVSHAVQEQMSLLMYGSASGSSGASSQGSRSGQPSNAAFVTWLDSHLSKSADTKIAALTDMLNNKLKEQNEAMAAVLMAVKQAEQAAKDASLDSEEATKIAASVKEAQDALAAVWAKDKRILEALIADIAADLKKTQKEAATASEAAATASAAAMEAAKTATAAAVMKSAQSESDSGGNIRVGINCPSTCQNVVQPENFQALTEDRVKLLIRDALSVFGADKTGMVDYALESAGGSVISTRCSETYYRRTAQLSLFGFPLWYISNSPRTVIQPEVQPGQCWAFKGSQGYIVIQMAGWVRPTSFSIEHIPKVLSPTGKIDSAPKDFTVWGLKSERDTEGHLLGNYTYLDNGEPLQFFQVQEHNVDAFHIVELRIHSNHGNQEYTCLYRFRVHGVLVKT